MMRFGFPHKVALVQQDGTRTEGVEAQVQKGGTILVSDTSHSISPGDKIEKELKGGGVVEYIVVDPHYHEGHGMNLDHIEVEVRKADTLSSEEGEEAGHTYNFHGDNARVNQDSVDRSINVASSNFGDVLNNFRDAVRQEIDDEGDRAEILDRLSALEDAQSSGGLEDVRQAWESLVARAANYTTITSFLWALARAAG